MERHGVSRSYAYELRRRAKATLSSMDDGPAGDARTLVLDERTLRRAVISLTLDCAASEEGILRFFRDVLQVQISVGKISGIIDEACRNARKFDESVRLDSVREAALDETFLSRGSPILTCIDLNSTYVTLMEMRGDRTGKTWASALGERREGQGLNPDVGVSDAGSGLTRGFSDAFPGAGFQLDVFHALRDIGRHVRRQERRAYGAIGKAYSREARLKREAGRGKPDGRLLKTLRKEAEESARLADAEAERCDTLCTLFSWLREIVGFSGYSHEDSLALANWILDEMDAVARHARNEGLLDRINSFRCWLPEILGFIDRLHRLMDKAAAEDRVPAEAYRALYGLRTLAKGADGRGLMEERVDEMLGPMRGRAEARLDGMIRATRRASSLVENLNGRVRRYINAKRVVTNDFLVLLKVYINTRKYRRSKVDGRVGKSPIELLLGKPCPCFFECIGF